METAATLSLCQKQPALYLEKLARLVCFGVVPQVLPVGKGIIRYLHGAGFVRLDLAERIIAEAVYEHGIDHTDEETRTLQRHSYRPPIHSRVLQLLHPRL